MVFLVYYEKQKCVICGKKFYPERCKVCRTRDFNTCASCHKHTSHHKQERAKIGIR